MILERYCYAETHTLGRLSFDGRVLHTIERGWKPGMPGGMPFVSSVPDGDYELVPHVRPGGDRVLALRNHSLGVYYSERSIPAEGGRYLILIHAANYAEEVNGCIAPGLSATIHENRHMVTNSRQAMRMVMEHYEAAKPDRLTIRPALGAV